MANAFSTIRNYKQPQSLVQGDLISTVLAAKQQKFDVNTQQISEAISQIGNIDLIRDEDKMYLYDNLKTVINTLDDTDNLDFTQSGIGSEISTYITRALDSEVLNQAANTSKIREYQNQVNKIKTEDHELYAQQNDWFATSQAGLMEYLNGDSDRLGDLNYTPYVDYNKEIEDNLFKWAKEFGFTPFYEKATTEDGISFMKEGEKLTQAEVKNFLAGRLDAKYQNQIYIDSSYNFKDTQTKDLLDKYNTYHSDRLDETTAEEYATMLDLKQKGYSSDDLKELKQNFADRKASHRKEMSRKDLDRGSIIKYLGIQSFLDTKSAAYAKTKYTKVSPDAVDVKRAELQLKAAEEKAKTVGSGVPGVMTTTVTPTTGAGEEVGALQSNALNRYAENKNTLLQGIIQSDKEFSEVYQSLESEEERNNIFEAKVSELTKVNIGGDVQPELRKQAFKYLSSAKDLNTINDAHSEVIKSKADKFYNSILSELQTENPDINLRGLSTTFPKTVELIQKKGNNLSPEDKEVIRYEFANGLKDVRGISGNAKNAIEEYISRQYNRVSNVEGVQDPNKPSAFKQFFTGQLQNVKGMFDVLMSGFDEEVIDQVREDYNFPDIAGMTREQGEAIGAVTDYMSSMGGLLTPDEDLSNLSEEDLQYRDSKGNIVRIADDLKASFEALDLTIDKELSSSERRLPQSFELVLDPVTAKYKPEIRTEVAAVFAQRTNKNPKDKDRLTLTVNKKDRSAVIRNISDSEELSGLTQLPIEQLPKSLLDKVETKESEWEFDVSNPSALPVEINYMPPLGENARAKSLKHINNLSDKYGIDIGTNIEAARKQYAPTGIELYNSLKASFPQASDEKIQDLVSSMYNIKYTPDRAKGVYRYEIFKNNSKVYDDYTNMNIFNEGLAALNNQSYINRYLNSELSQ